MFLSLEDQIKSVAREIGFSLAGIATAEPDERSGRLYRRWLDAGRHGEMKYLERHRVQREDPRLLLPGALSAICVAVNYYHEEEKRQRRADGSDGRGVFSIHVHNEDYHDVLGQMLATLAQRLEHLRPGTKSIACVDTRPISDRSMAFKAGIAWPGKNTCAISPEFGSWIFLGTLLTTLQLEPDQPLETLCGSCSRCIDACPTGALSPFSLDANRCISYLTVEKRGEIDKSLRGPIGLDVYGCDTCQSVCPFNDVASESVVFDRGQRSPLVDMTLNELVALDDVAFRNLTEGSSIRRCKSEGLQRNAAIVRANTKEGPLLQPAARFTLPE